MFENVYFQEKCLNFPRWYLLVLINGHLNVGS